MESDYARLNMICAIHHMRHGLVRESLSLTLRFKVIQSHKRCGKLSDLVRTDWQEMSLSFMICREFCTPLNAIDCDL